MTVSLGASVRSLLATARLFFHSMFPWLPKVSRSAMPIDCSVPADASEEEVLAAALADEKVSAQVVGKQVVKKIVVPGRLVNVAAS